MDRSLWIESTKPKRYKNIIDDKETDICIIGGGLTGITTAYYLTKENKKVIVLEKDYIGSKTSGNTTGKITSGHGLIYDYLIKSVGEEKTKQYLEANEQAIKNIEKIINKENIDCDFEKKNNYIFTQDKKYINTIRDEVEAVKKLGLDVKFLEKLELPINPKKEQLKDEIVNNKKDNISIKKPILAAIEYPNQAQFNSYKYLTSLAEKVEENGGIIYEGTNVINIRLEGDDYIIETEEAKVKAKIIVLACHYPIINFPGFYFMKMYQETSYLIALETNKELFEGMYINAEEPTISLRTAKYNGKNILIVGGMSHKTGAKIDLKNSYSNLEKIAKSIYPDSKVIFRWNSEDCISLDKIPYIGEFSNLMPDVYVATGYKKWGMTLSNVAANIISNKILNKENKYADVFDSKRLKPIKNYKELANMVKEVGNSLVINRLKRTDEKLNNINKDEGQIIEIDSQKVGVYKDKDGNIFAVKPYCSHLGCELSWNNLDKTWDCPCHGSRFDFYGKNIYNPAIKDLDRIDIFD